jgi:hypothetical protein
MKIFISSINLLETLERIQSVGYAFVSNGLTEEARQFLLDEINSLPLEEGDHVNHAINKNKPNEVHQLHERAYSLLDDPRVPHASFMCRKLAQEITAYSSEFPELAPWLVNEIGYQRYRGNTDWISPHRDRKSDHLLSVTFTLSGSAPINIYRPLTQDIDYRHLEKIETFVSEPGTIFFLRAPGFGSAEQIIHEVMPPTVAPRNILNLRMRDSLLPSPKNTYYE